MDITVAVLYGDNPFWVVGDHILARDGVDNPPLVYPSEMFACLYGLIDLRDLCLYARAREAKLVKARSDDFIYRGGKHPGTLGLP